MFLKSLDIFGFKSFADRTHIEFSEGITALLGPNGCGKSNVVDAVKWVLGEQAAKTMRAEKMEDIIFNGTETRKPLNVAEVCLTLSNEKNLLPLDMSEIAIKRRLYRSGESEYFINNNPCKLKDIRELFWDTGVGKTAYSVMEQGKIDQILSSKPEDRRYLFEEAAGITRFKVKRAEAERKLERTEENMRQIEVVLAEVKRSYDTLKVQSEKTISYRNLRESIFNLELDTHLLRLKGFSLDKHQRNEELKKVTQKRDEVRQEIESITVSLTENMDKVNAMQGQINEMQTNIISIAVEKNEKEKLAKVLIERQFEIKSKISQLNERIKNIKNKIEGLQEDADEQDAQVHDLSKRLGEIQKNIISFEENISHSSNQITENDKQAAAIEREIVGLDQNRTLLEQDLEAITEDIVTELDSKLKSAGYSSQHRQEALTLVVDLLAQIQLLAAGRKTIFNEFTTLSLPSETDSRNLAQAGLKAFNDIESLIEKLQLAVDAYAKTTPGFIDEFLSPEGIITKKRSLDAKIQDNKNLVADKREQIVELRSVNSKLVVKIDEYRKTLENLRLNQVQMKAQVQSAEDQVRLIRRELAGQEALLREQENELFSETKRLEDLTSQVLDIEGDIASLEYKGVHLTKDLENLEKSVLSSNTDVSSKQEKLKAKNLEMNKIQAQLEKIHLDLSTSETEIRNLQENFRDAHSRDLMEFEERMYTITDSLAGLREKLSVSRQTFKDLGTVNLMAPEEFAETKERHDFYVKQIADTQKARDDLLRIAEEIRSESTELFLATYNKIKKNFHNMFRRLFGGGRAELRLVDPKNVLESGIDIFAQPPGKKLENIALLSGGEKTMTAVSLLFATYMVRPSPFCLLDEIDAALDEQNVLRFVQMLREFGSISQYIVITHNKKTVTGAGTLLGLTMLESGVTQVVTLKLENENGVGGISLPDNETFEEEDVEEEADVYVPPHPPKRNLSNADSQAGALP